MFNAVIDAPFGKIGVRLEGEAVREIVYLPDSVANVEPDSPLARQAVEQIEQNRFLARVIMVQARFRGAARGGQIRHRRARIAGLGEFRGGEFENLFALGFVVGGSGAGHGR